MNRSDALVEPNWLALHLEDPCVRIVDVRWFLPLTGRSAHAEYMAGHVPGATFVDLDHDLAAHNMPSGGRHPLPDPANFARVLGAHGISPSTHVVAYDDSAGSTAARLWWMLKQVGHARVSVLDGGLASWMREGLPIEVGASPERAPETYPPAPFSRFGEIVTREEVLPALGAGAVLLDARAPERFQGRSEPIDPRAGHIPGARNAPFAGNLEPTVGGTMRFLSSDALRARFGGRMQLQGGKRARRSRSTFGSFTPRPRLSNPKSKFQNQTFVPVSFAAPHLLWLLLAPALWLGWELSRRARATERSP